MKKVRCAVRKALVAAHPEELVRQELLCRMIGQLGYPSHLLVVEKELSLLPHLALQRVVQHQPLVQLQLARVHRLQQLVLQAMRHTLI